MGNLGAPEILILLAIALVVAGLTAIIVKATRSRSGNAGYVVYPPQVYPQTFVPPQAQPPTPAPQPAAVFCGHCGAPMGTPGTPCPSCGKAPI